MKWELKLAHPTPEVTQFLFEVKHPHVWSVEKLERHAFLLKGVTQDNELVGYFWFTLVPDTWKMFELHMAVDPKFHSVWFNRRDMKKLKDMATLLDADSVLFFHPQSSQRLKQLERHGFEVMPPFAILQIKENQNGGTS